MNKLKIRKLWGIIARMFSPGYFWCGRCKRPWNVCEGHYTQYNKSSSCFPLCQQCWKELTIEERLPFYWDLWWRWKSHSCQANHNGVAWNDLWLMIEKSVMKGY